ncbi:MAG: ISAzo13 family transposase, partial [Nitrospirae bacterium]|nr:ISAzo13 family transposase [Nitrospirota bacterium]
IAGATSAKGLRVTCRLDRRRYPVGRNVSNEELATVNVTPDAFHGEWNYTIRPRKVHKL